MALLSIIALINIHIANYTYILEVTPEGVNNYISSFSEYKTLFASTITVIAAYFGLERLNEATIANNEKVKQDRFIEWKFSIEHRLAYADEKNPQIRKVFASKRFYLFNDLYAINFIVKDKKKLEDLFNKYFKDIVPFIERQNQTYLKQAGIYPSEKYSYSYDAFRYLFFGCCPYENYLEIEVDLASLFLHELPNSRIINEKSYQLATLKC